MSRSSPINSYFEKTFCINMDRRPDKLSLSLEEFRKHNLIVERFPAIDGNTLNTAEIIATTRLTPAEIGCSMSHAAILRMMIDNRWKRVLVLEDDVEFVEDLQNVFTRSLPLMPKEWDMLYLGGNHVRLPTTINQSFGKVLRTFTTGHYAITLSMAEKVVEMVEKLDWQVDVVYAGMHSSTNCCTFRPALAWQKPGFSDIQNGFRDYTKYIKR